MEILIVSPARPDERLGNAITANRWASALASLGHRARVATRWDGDADALFALHAGRSAGSIARFAAEHPRAPLVVVLTGTDLYRDLHTGAAVPRSLELATRIVVLQDDAVHDVPAAYASKVRVVRQSVDVTEVVPERPAHGFQVCTLAHLRPVKAPDLAWRALALVPNYSRIRWVHLGRALDPELGDAARAESTRNPRYEWLGERPRDEALAVLAGSHLHVLTSEVEGASGALIEAIALGVPTIATRIEGNVGVLGAEHPGLFPTGDVDALAELLVRVEADAGFYRELRAATSARAPRFTPQVERDALARLLADLGA